MTDAIARAGTIYFAGRNDGVAEELTLKTNEITRKKSDYLEGTYAVHGIEEVMNPDDVVILDRSRSPPRSRRSKRRSSRASGMKVFAVADRGHDLPDGQESPMPGHSRPTSTWPPAGTSWSRSERHWGSISTSPSGPARSGNEFHRLKKPF